MLFNISSRWDINQMFQKHVEQLKEIKPLPPNWFWYKDKIDELQKVDETLIRDVLEVHKRILDKGFSEKSYFMLRRLYFYLSSMKQQKSDIKLEEQEAQIVTKYIKEMEEVLAHYLEASKQYYSGLLPEADLGKVMTAKGEYFWHAGLTGQDGAVIDSIIKNGLLPRKLAAKDNLRIGNVDTGDKGAAYAANDGANALHYLKTASDGYNYAIGGLPFIVCIKINEFTKEYCFDSDLTAGFDNPSKDNAYAWLALILTYETVDDFLNDKSIETSLSCKDLKKLFHEFSAWKTREKMNNIFKIVYEYLYLDESHFYEGQRLDNLRVGISNERWNMFLRILTSLRSGAIRPYYSRNISKENGWNSSFIKRVFVISPNKDKDWRHWAKIMPPTREYLTHWEKWSEMVYVDEIGNKKYFPGNGGLVRVI